MLILPPSFSVRMSISLSSKPEMRSPTVGCCNSRARGAAGVNGRGLGCLVAASAAFELRILVADLHSVRLRCHMHMHNVQFHPALRISALSAASTALRTSSCGMQVDTDVHGLSVSGLCMMPVNAAWQRVTYG